MPNNAPEPSRKKKLSPTQIILIAGITLIVAAVVAVGCVLLLRSSPEAPAAPVAAATPGTGNVVVDEQNATDLVEELKRKAAKGMFEVKMNSTWNFPDGASPSTDAYVANSEANHLPLYFDLLVGEEEEIVYTSPVLEVGTAVKEFALTKKLEAGSYEAVCAFHTLNEDDTVAATIRVAVTVEVKA